MKIVVAPDSFKGSVSSKAVGDAVEKGIKKVFESAEVVKLQIADGGEGTVDAYFSAAGEKIHKEEVTDPLGGKTMASFAVLKNGICVIEMAQAAGLSLVKPEKLNPLITTTYGVGELIKKALDLRIKKIIIGLGGSATNDAGAGMAQALGVSFKDKDGKEIPFGGGFLGQVCSVDTSAMDCRIKNTEIIMACDVSNPLLGEKGASRIFGPQKGATEDMVQILDENLKHFSHIIKTQTGSDYADNPGAGAAGGLGYGLQVFCGAKFKSGIDTILDAINFDEFLKGCHLIITGEGRIDSQSAFGKVPVGISKRAKSKGIPVLAIVGSVGLGADECYKFGINSIMPITDKPMKLEEAMENGERLIEEAAERAMRMVKIGINIE